MQSKLKDLNGQLYVFHSEAIAVFEMLNEKYNIQDIFSHQEIGNKITYKRDITIKKFCKDNAIDWKEYQHNGVIRKLKSRKEWEQRWKQKMQETPKLVEEQEWVIVTLDTTFYKAIKGPDLNAEIMINN